MGGEGRPLRVVFAGGGTGGHIYPGIAVADALMELARRDGVAVEIHWLGSRDGMDRSIVERNLVSAGGSIAAFHGIPCGKLRRYLSLRNVIDLFKVAAGLVASARILRRMRPEFLFSKGGFVSVPPCRAARALGIPYVTHECDLTPGLATRLNAGGARHVLLSYGETARHLPESVRPRCLVTGNPVRPAFYADAAAAGRRFLGLPEEGGKPVLLVLGGSLGALQINRLVQENLGWLAERFVVVHQTGRAFADENPGLFAQAGADYKPYPFIHGEMPAVIQAADVVLSRAGANSLWECAVCARPMVLVPLCGSGTRGDQVDNARFFERQGAAVVLAGEEADGPRLRAALERLLDAGERARLSAACRAVCGDGRPAEKIAALIMRAAAGRNG